MNFKDYLQKSIVYLDGGMGTMLQQRGLEAGELPERWNVTHKEVVQEIHQHYLEAGSNVISTNTFGANALKFSEEELNEIIQAAVKNAKAATARGGNSKNIWVALDIGPTGKLLKPYGDLDFESAVEIFAKTIRLGVQYGVDLIFIETMSDSLECKAAVLAAKENSSLPVIVSCAFGSDGKLTTGATPAAMVAMLEGLRVDALGANCSLGPKQLICVIDELLACASVPVLVKPNAGLPVLTENVTQFDVTEAEFAEYMAQFVSKGARLIGGCCGTTPKYIQKTVELTEKIVPMPIVDKWRTCVSSYTHAVSFEHPILIGERINPTGKKLFKQALREKDVSYVLAEAIEQEKNGAHVLDVNVGLPDLDERVELPYYVQEIQAVSNLPLQIDSSNVDAMARAMRIYNGKPMINSVCGKKESMNAVFPLVQKYGGVVIALTLDENGIPDTADERVEIARKIVKEAEKYGISPKDILVDPLTMAISTNPNAAKVTLEALVRIQIELGVGTSLGISNISFGLPSREIINANFFALALEKGLSAAIINPNSMEMLKVYYAHKALKGSDENCTEYVRFATEKQASINSTPPLNASQNTGSNHLQATSILQSAIVHGMREEALVQCEKLLQNIPTQDLIEKEIVPALDIVGRAYEEKRAYLPQLLMSAEAAKAAFSVIKKQIFKENTSIKKGKKVILATVKGDIHDIGKNIVGTILENYGYQIIDLGKDVSPNAILEAVKYENAEIVGLSALMTTTVPHMEETIQLLKNCLSRVKIMVGGAVLTKEYAEKIHADAYAKDAMEAVRILNQWTIEK